MKTLLFIFFICTAFLCRSQVALSYFPFQSLICISSNTEKLIWGDFKLETNTFFTNMNMELSPKINIKRTELANYYLGPGANFNPVYAAADLPLLNGYFLDIGVRVKPFKEHRNLQIVFEISPYLNQSMTGNLRTRLGVAYNFTKHSKPKN